MYKSPPYFAQVFTYVYIMLWAVLKNNPLCSILCQQLATAILQQFINDFIIFNDKQAYSAL